MIQHLCCAMCNVPQRYPRKRICEFSVTVCSLLRCSTQFAPGLVHFFDIFEPSVRGGVHQQQQQHQQQFDVSIGVSIPRIVDAGYKRKSQRSGSVCFYRSCVYMFKRLFFLLGPPAAGKGTQAALLRQRSGWSCISAGDELRKASQHDPEIQSMLDDGVIVPAEVTVKLLTSRILELSEDVNPTTNVLIDGFPRSVEQATHLPFLEAACTCVDNTAADGVRKPYFSGIFLNVSDDIAKIRMRGRLIHEGSGRIYHELYAPPKVDGLDDVTGERLIRRTDDNDETFARRLHSFHVDTIPVNSYLGSTLSYPVIGIDGNLSIEKTFYAISSVLGTMEGGVQRGV